MKFKNIKIILIAVVGGALSASAQTPTPSPSPTAAPPQPTPSQDGQSLPTATPIPNSTPTLQTPGTQSLTIYRKASTVGILQATGAELTLPNVPAPLVRFVMEQGGHLDVVDTAFDGVTVTQSSWDISSLTDPYQPENGGLASSSDDSDNEYVPDRYSKEALFTTTTLEPSQRGPHPNVSSVSSGSSFQISTAVTNVAQGGTIEVVPLGSVFVDDANRIFFMPPKAPLFFPIPADVTEIVAVTHLASNNTIVAEWTKEDEDNYHMVTLDATAGSTRTDVQPADSLHSQREITWADSTHLLARHPIHGATLYSTIDLGASTVSAELSSSNGQIMKINNGIINTYTYPDGD